MQRQLPGSHPTVTGGLWVPFKLQFDQEAAPHLAAPFNQFTSKPNDPHNNTKPLYLPGCALVDSQRRLQGIVIDPAYQPRTARQPSPTARSHRSASPPTGFHYYSLDCHTKMPPDWRPEFRSSRVQDFREADTGASVCCPEFAGPRKVREVASDKQKSEAEEQRSNGDVIVIGDD